MTGLLILKKALDTLNYSILLKKLEIMGIRRKLLLWVTNYLHERSQTTFVNGCLSGNLPIICGVPQGSILGPLFFIPYINYIKHYLKDSDFDFSADDAVLFSHARGKFELKIQKRIYFLNGVK